MTQLCCYVDFSPLPRIFVEAHQSSNHEVFFLFSPSFFSSFFFWTVLNNADSCVHGVCAPCYKGAGPHEGGAGFPRRIPLELGYPAFESKLYIC